MRDMNVLNALEVTDMADGGIAVLLGSEVIAELFPITTTIGKGFFVTGYEFFLLGREQPLLPVELSGHEFVLSKCHELLLQVNHNSNVLPLDLLMIDGELRKLAEVLDRVPEGTERDTAILASLLKTKEHAELSLESYLVSQQMKKYRDIQNAYYQEEDYNETDNIH